MKPIVFGREIAAADVERMRPDTGPHQLVRLAGALIRTGLARAGVPTATLSITERINVPDHGIDAECSLPQAPNVVESGGLVGPGRTVFQFKYRDPVRGPRKELVRELVRTVRSDTRRLKDRYDRYVLITNLHLAGTDMRKLREAVSRDGLDIKSPVVIWGAAEVANAVNASPHLRHAFFAEGGLSTVDVAEAELKAAYRDINWPPFIGREREVAAIRAFLDDPAHRVLRVRGPRYSGKTRLVLEALRPVVPAVLWAASPTHVSLDLFRDLDSVEEQSVLVIDRTDGAAWPELLEWAEQRQQLKTILVLRDSDGPGAPSEDEVLVTRLDDEDAQRLLGSVAPRLAFAVGSWILDAAGGLPGLILQIAALVRDSTLTPSGDPRDVERRLGELIAKRYEAPLGAQALQALEVAAVLPALGFEGPKSDEADIVATALERDPSLLRSNMIALERGGVIRRRGRFIEVVPPALADYLASSALRHPGFVERLVVALSPARFMAFLERLSRVRTPAATEIIDDLLAMWSSTLDSLVDNAEKFQALAPARPARALRGIEQCLVAVTANDLRARVTGRARRALAWTLHDLALRSATFEGAARLLLLLAEAENESYDNNATGVFTSLFSWRRPQITASLSRRLAVLANGQDAASPARKQVVADAAGRAFRDSESFALHRARGPMLPEPEYRPETWEDVGKYGLGVLNVLSRLLRDNDERVREAATKALLDIWVALMVITIRLPAGPDGLPELAVRAIEMLADIGRSTESAKVRVATAERLQYLVTRLSQNNLSGPGVPRELARRADQLRHELTSASLRDRLWWWVGPSRWERAGGKSEEAEAASALDSLADELVENTAQFEESLDWLMGPEANRAGELFHLIGVKDAQRGLLDALMRRHQHPAWPDRFAAYIAGHSSTDRAAVERELDRLLETRPDLIQGVLKAIVSMPFSAATPDRIVRVLAKGLPDMAEAAGLLAWWLPRQDLSAHTMERLLEACDDGTREVRGALLFAFIRRTTSELSPRLRLLAWEFLRSSFVPETQSGYRHNWDDLAAQLGAAEPDRLLELIREISRQQLTEDRRGYLWHQELPLAWETLLRVDRRGVLRLILELASRPNAPFEAGVTLEETIDPGRDRADLMDIAHEIGIDAAHVIAINLDPDTAGSWELARDLLARWGEDERLRSRLLMAVLSGGWQGSPLPVIEKRLADAKRLATDPSPVVATWAEETVSELQAWRVRAQLDESEDWMWDYRVRRAELESMVKGPPSAERLWAIGRLLQHAPRDRVLELLRPEEILEALPEIQGLDERTREAWESWARYWSARH